MEGRHIEYLVTHSTINDEPSTTGGLVSNSASLVHVISHNDSFVDEAIRLTVLGKVRSDCSMDGWMVSGVACRPSTVLVRALQRDRARCGNHPLTLTLTVMK